jgi:hypothetical protein
MLAIRCQRLGIPSRNTTRRRIRREEASQVSVVTWDPGRHRSGPTFHLVHIRFASYWCNHASLETWIHCRASDDGNWSHNALSRHERHLIQPSVRSTLARNRAWLTYALMSPYLDDFKKIVVSFVYFTRPTAAMHRVLGHDEFHHLSTCCGLCGSFWMHSIPGVVLDVFTLDSLWLHTLFYACYANLISLHICWGMPWNTLAT